MISPRFIGLLAAATVASTLATTLPSGSSPAAPSRTSPCNGSNAVGRASVNSGSIPAPAPGMATTSPSDDFTGIRVEQRPGALIKAERGVHPTCPSTTAC